MISCISRSAAIIINNCNMSETATKGSGKVYEIGFQIAPFVGDENIAHEVSEIKAVLEKLQAAVISEDFPRLRALAYPISKEIKGEKRNFREGYFGWIKFEAEPEAAVGLKKEVEKMDNVIRFLIIKTVRENTLYGAKFAAKERMAPRRDEIAKPRVEVKQEVNVEEVDKAIEELIVE